MVKKSTKKASNVALLQNRATPANRAGIRVSGRVMCGILGAVMFVLGLIAGYYLLSPRQISHELTQDTPHIERNVDREIPACQRVEEIMKEYLQMHSNPNSPNFYDHIDRAKAYIVIAENGCPENIERYKKLAADELQISSALAYRGMGTDFQIEVIDLYKKMEMQQAAQKFFDKMKKLTDPAIDFILNIEKIINE